MPVPTNTTLTATRVGIREDLEDLIYNIDPEETPILSLIGRIPARGVTHDWQNDTFRAPALNAQLEGDSRASSARAATTRPVNTCQIVSDDIRTSGTAKAVRTAGRADEHAYQVMKGKVELKRDLEWNLFRETGRSVSEPRRARNFESWLTTNVSRGVGGANGSDLVAPTDGTARAFSQGLLDTVLQSMWSSGAKVNKCKVMVGPAVKTVFATFPGRTSQRVEVPKDAIYSNADVYVSNFGQVEVLPSRWTRARSALIIDPSMVNLAVLRDIFDEPLAKDGDSVRTLIGFEGTLVVKNERAHGVVADLT